MDISPRIYRIYAVLYIILASVYLGFYVQNLSVTYTWFSNLGAPGASLVSYRGTFVDVTIRLSIFAHIFCPAIVLLLLDSKILYGIYIIFTTLTLLAVVGMGTSYSTCNTAFGNICNDYAYCCKYPGNGCPTVIPCPSVLQLNPNDTFLGLFWINFVLFLMQLVYIIVKLYDSKKKEEPKEDEEEEEKKEEEKEEPKEEVVEEKKTPPAPIVLNARIDKRLHGLRRIK